jgi:hypothetical protein
LLSHSASCRCFFSGAFFAELVGARISDVSLHGGLIGVSSLFLSIHLIFTGVFFCVGIFCSNMIPCLYSCIWLSADEKAFSVFQEDELSNLRADRLSSSSQSSSSNLFFRGRHLFPSLFPNLPIELPVVKESFSDSPPLRDLKLDPFFNNRRTNPGDS